MFCYYIKSVIEPKMSVAKNQKDIFQMFYGEIPEKIKKRLRRPLKPIIEIEDEFYMSSNKNYK